MRGYDHTRLLHYERAFSNRYPSVSDAEKKELNELFDFYCYMYPLLEEVETIFEDESIEKYGYDLAQDYILLKQIGITMKNIEV